MRIRTFIFEDDPQIRDLLAIIALKRNHEVTTYSDPLESDLFRCRSEYGCNTPHPHIVLTDYDMPHATGLELLRTLMHVNGLPFPENAALVTASDTTAIRRETKDLGCRFFRKPFHAEDINRWLKECEERIVERQTCA